MGKKERIAELESQVAALSFLIRSIRTRFGLEDPMPDPITITKDEIPTHYQQIHDRIAHLRDQAAAGASRAMVVAAPAARMVDAEERRIQDDQVRTWLDRMAKELDLHLDDEPTGEAMASVLAAMKDLKGSHDNLGDGAMVAKGDSLAQAIDHNLAERAHLAAELTSARTTINRIASALQVQQVDADGSQILEKAQRWAVFAYGVKKRYAEWNRLASQEVQSSVSAAVVRDEFGKVLADLVAPKLLAEWLKAKAPSAVSEAVLRLAEDQHSGHRFAPITPRDVSVLRSILQFGISADNGLSSLADIFQALEASAVARDEFVRLMNLVILPIITRLEASPPPPTPN